MTLTELHAQAKRDAQSGAAALVAATSPARRAEALQRIEATQAARGTLSYADQLLHGELRKAQPR